MSPAAGSADPAPDRTESPASILSFWFGSEGEDDATIAARQAGLWWRKQADTDRAMRERFAPWLTGAAAGELDHWATAPTGRLALILLTDQFPRSIHRGRAEAFSLDAEARSLCVKGLELGQDRELGPLERAFFYLPLEHSESLEDQRRCVALFTELERIAPGNLRDAFAGFTRFAIAHHDIVMRFGRFPHRNRVLGRPNTAEEAVYLAGDAPGFGQR